MWLLQKLSALWEDKAEAVTEAYQVQERAKKYFTERQIEILKSPWGMCRLEQLRNDNNKRMPILHKVSMLSFDDIVKNKEDKTNYWVGNGYMISPIAFGRMQDTEKIVQTVLDEGANKSPKQLKVPGIRLVSEIDEELVYNPGWIKIQELILEYNNNVTEASEKLFVGNKNDLQEYVNAGLVLRNTPFANDNDQSLKSSDIGKAMVILSIVERAAENTHDYGHPPPP